MARPRRDSGEVPPLPGGLWGRSGGDRRQRSQAQPIAPRRRGPHCRRLSNRAATRGRGRPARGRGRGRRSGRRRSRCSRRRGTRRHRRPSRPRPSRAAGRRSAGGSAAASDAASGWCALGMTSTWVGACGLMSRKATVVSVSRTTSAGTSPATILQNRQSACGSPATGAPFVVGVVGACATGCYRAVRTSGRYGPAARQPPPYRPSRCAARCGPAGTGGHRPPRTRPVPRARRRPPARRRARCRRAAGSSAAASGAAPSSCSTAANAAPASSGGDRGGVVRLGHLGEPQPPGLLARLARRGCATWRATSRPRSPFQRVTQRDAAHGTIASTPVSVMVSTASSPRSPLGSACTTVMRGAGGGLGAQPGDRDLQPVLALDGGDRAVGAGARAVGEHDLLAGPQPPHGDRVPALGPVQDDRARGEPAARRSTRRRVRSCAPPVPRPPFGDEQVGPVRRRAAAVPAGAPGRPTGPCPAGRRPGRPPCAAAR